MELFSNSELHERRYLEGAVCLDLNGIEFYDTSAKIVDYYKILFHFKKCQLDKTDMLGEKDKQEEIKRINDFIEKYDNSDTQIKLINHLAGEMDWNKRQEIQRLVEKVSFTDENALVLVKKNLEFLYCLGKIPINVLEYIFLDNSLILNPWMHNVAVTYILKAARSTNIVKVPEIKFKNYFENYLRRIPWSLGTLVNLDESEAKTLLLTSIRQKFSHDWNYHYTVGVKKGRFVTERMTEKEYVKFKSKDIIKFLSLFPKLITKDFLSDIIMLFPELIKKGKDNKNLKETINNIMADEKFMENFMVVNSSFCTKKRSLSLLEKLNVSKEIIQKISQKKKEKKSKKTFKY